MCQNMLCVAFKKISLIFLQKGRSIIYRTDKEDQGKKGQANKTYFLFL